MKEEKLVSKNGEWEFSNESWVKSSENWPEGFEFILETSSGKFLDLTDSSDKVNLLNLEDKESWKKWLIVAAQEEGWFKLTKLNSGRVLTATTKTKTEFTKGNEIDPLFLKGHSFHFPFNTLPVLTSLELF